MSPQARASLACGPELTHLAVAQAAMRGAREPLVCELLTDHVQLVPPGADVLDEGLAEALAKTWPSTAFRLHANVRGLPQRRLADLCTFERDRDWFVAAARVHRALGATAYSAHAGLRRDTDCGEMLDNARRCADLFGCDVAIEGQYPVAGDDPHRFLLRTWEEHRALLDSGAPFALDLSDLNILAHRSRRREDTLVAEMLASPACLEVHVSGNDGHSDSHEVLRVEPWWWPLLHHIQPRAVVFGEGSYRRTLSGRNPHAQL